MTLVLLDDTLAVTAVISPTPIVLDGIADPQYAVTFSMWQRVLDSVAKMRFDPGATRGVHSRQLVGMESLVTQLDGSRLGIVNPVRHQWAAAQLKAQAPWKNMLRAEWSVVSAAVESAGGKCLLSEQQAKGLHRLTPTARIATPVRHQQGAAFEVQ